MKRLQIYYPEDLLEDLKLYAKNHNMPLAEAIRLASREFAQKPQVKLAIKTWKNQVMKSHRNPWLTMAGMLKGGPTNTSSTIDTIYNE